MINRRLHNISKANNPNETLQWYTSGQEIRFSHTHTWLGSCLQTSNSEVFVRIRAKSYTLSTVGLNYPQVESVALAEATCKDWEFPE